MNSLIMTGFSGTADGGKAPAVRKQTHPVMNSLGIIILITHQSAPDGPAAKLFSVTEAPAAEAVNSTNERSTDRWDVFHHEERSWEGGDSGQATWIRAASPVVGVEEALHWRFRI
jgi:hypothetical protein